MPWKYKIKAINYFWNCVFHYINMFEALYSLSGKNVKIGPSSNESLKYKDIEIVKFESGPCCSHFFRGTYHIHTRVANVVGDHNDLLTQWRPIKKSKFGTNIFLIRTTYNYFWALVFKNQRFKCHLFSFSQYKKNPKLKTWVSFYAIIILY